MGGNEGRGAVLGFITMDEEDSSAGDSLSEDFRAVDFGWGRVDGLWPPLAAEGTSPGSSHSRVGSEEDWGGAGFLDIADALGRSAGEDEGSLPLQWGPPRVHGGPDSLIAAGNYCSTSASGLVVATFNVSSRLSYCDAVLRAGQIVALATDWCIDVLCLSETSVPSGGRTEAALQAAIAHMGWSSVFHNSDVPDCPLSHVRPGI